MSIISPPGPVTPIEYPDSDGKPMSDNTKQARWITTLYGNLCALYRDRPDVFVAADLLWYPVEGEPTVRTAPDVLVVFGRPKGDRGSYLQWAEDNIPVHVVFEILSPGNEPPEMADKYTFYTEHGVEEYYVYDPDDDHLEVYVRQGTALRRVRPPDGFRSPRMGVHFDLSGEEMVVYRPDGRRFLTFEELEAEREELAKGAGDLRRRMARLVELGRKARLQQATPEELAELERLESEAAP